MSSGIKFTKVPTETHGRTFVASTSVPSSPSLWILWFILGFIVFLEVEGLLIYYGYLFAVNPILDNGSTLTSTRNFNLTGTFRASDVWASTVSLLTLGTQVNTIQTAIDSLNSSIPLYGQQGVVTLSANGTASVLTTFYDSSSIVTYSLQSCTPTIGYLIMTNMTYGYGFNFQSSYANCTVGYLISKAF